MLCSVALTLLASLLLSSRAPQDADGRSVSLGMRRPRSSQEAFGEASKSHSKGPVQRCRTNKHVKQGISEKLTPTKIPPSRVHPRNAFQGSYDMDQLTDAYPNLHPFVQPSHTSKAGRPTIDFSDFLAVRSLNAALLASDYEISFWEEFLPASSLCPPVPGRADYIHYLADILSESAASGSDILPRTQCHEGRSPPPLQDAPRIPTGRTIRGLDVGTGASLIYPLIGTQTYGWHFICTDTEATSIASARQIASANELLADEKDSDGRLNIRLQPNKSNILQGVLSEEEVIDFVMCNPPFYESAEAYQKESNRKMRNLASNRNKRRGTTTSNVTAGRDHRGARSKRKGSTATTSQAGSNNFGGGSSELWYPGGEVSFISTLIRESCTVANQCLWFSSLVSRRDNLPALISILGSVKTDGRYSEATVKDTRIIEMGQGQKSSSILFWSYHDRNEQREWCRRRAWTFGNNSS